MELFLGYFLPMILCLLELMVLFFTDVKACIVHILLWAFAFIPVMSWLSAIVMFFVLLFGIQNGYFKLKVNEVTKFLFNAKEDD